ncbi:c-type cytochrome [Aquibium sp. LZ166]|uniref:C-type cytochrome n=1 Tax=Aquibium pacificus TaxID=3153579 RepID=A0ABV3SFQ0_9HYPH
MWRPKKFKAQRAAFYLIVFMAIGAVGAAGLMLSGVYNVAASARHFSITEYLIKVVLWRSVAFHSRGGPEAPDLADPGLIRLGANHFAAGCAPCHGSPGQDRSAAVDRMYPAPPPLDLVRDDFDTSELFWIVQNGFKFTGMPAWPGEGRKDEVWPLVAYLEHLPETSPAEFASMTSDSGGTFRAQHGLDFGVGFAPSGEGLLRYCATCHGEAGARPVDGLVPALAGQNAAYLRRSLEEYQQNRRQSGMMETVAAELDTDTIAELADYYSRARLADQTVEQRPDAASIERGRAIALQGIPTERVPPCAACHSGTKSDQFPRLTGLSATYIEVQLQLFHDGVRAQSPYAEIMHNVARYMNREQMEDVAAYLASLPPGAVFGAESAARREGR